MNTKKTKVDVYVEETVCGCGGELELISEKSKGLFRDTTIYIYKCKDCGKEYKDSDFLGFGKEIEKTLVFEYNGKKYIYGRLR